MKKSILFSLIAIFFAFLLLTPVMAAPKVNTQFKEKISLIAGNVSQGSQVTLGDTLYVTNGVSMGIVTYVSGVDLSGALWTKLSGSFNMTTGIGSFNGKWQIIASNGVFAGSVTGSITTIGVNPNIFGLQGTYVGFGSGSHQGEKIKGSFQGNTLAGTLIVNLEMTGVLSDKI